MNDLNKDDWRRLEKLEITIDGVKLPDVDTVTISIQNERYTTPRRVTVLLEMVAIETLYEATGGTNRIELITKSEILAAKQARARV